MLMRLPIIASLLASAAAYNVARQAVSDASDTTVTVTVTDENTQTVTDVQTVFKTVVSTIQVTSTTVVTSTVTSKDVDTATETKYVTITQPAKRWILNPMPAAGAETPARQAITEVPAMVTSEPDADNPVELLIKKGWIEKRAIITETVTIAVDSQTTVTTESTKTVVKTTTSEVLTTSTILSTTFLNAKTTTTITSTIIIKQTTVQSGPDQTVDSLPPDSNVATDSSFPQSTSGSASSSGSSGGGLSTGAKAGIGAGCAVVGLALLGGLGYWYYKHRQNKPRVVDDGTGAGMSEVPVGGIGFPAAGGAGTSSRHSRTSEPKPRSPIPPSSSPVAYKESGPAELGGTSKLPAAELGDDALPPMPTPNDADGREAAPAPRMQHKSGPVFEMPDQPYR